MTKVDIVTTVDVDPITAKFMTGDIEGGMLDLKHIAVEEDADPRWEIEVGTVFEVKKSDLPHFAPGLYEVTSRRNGYPKPFFDCWFPLVMLVHIDDMEYQPPKGYLRGAEFHQDVCKKLKKVQGGTR